MTVSERMFSIMQEKGLKSIDLAKYININKSVISTWKNRGTNPPAEYIVQICEFLGVSYSLLLTGKEENEDAIPKKFYTKMLLSFFNSLPQEEKEQILKDVAVQYFEEESKQ